MHEEENKNEDIA